MPLESRLAGVYRKQVDAAAAADERRQVVDAAKKRAIVTAATYGDFRALVDTCHLKPLSREEIARQPQRFLNPHATGASGFSLSNAGTGSNSNSCSAENQQLNSQAQLRKQWEARGANPDDQCCWLMEQPQESLQRLFSVEMDPQLLLQFLKALALHLSTLADSRCSSCCCCCQTRSAASAAAAESAAAAPQEDAFCCRIAYRVSLTAGFLSFLAELQGTARGARLLLPQELQQVRCAFEQSLARLHAPVVAASKSRELSVGVEAAAAPVCCCASGDGGTTAPEKSQAESCCCHTKRAVQTLLRALGDPQAAVQG